MKKKIVAALLAVVFFYVYHQLLSKIAGFFNVFARPWESFLATVSYFLILFVIAVGTVYLVVKILESDR